MKTEVKVWRKGEFYFVLLLFIFTLYYVVEAFSFPPMSRFFPVIVGGAALVIVTVDLLQLMIPKLGRRFRGFKGGELFKTEKEEELARALEEAKQGDTIKEEGGKAIEESPTMGIIKIFLWFVGAYLLFYFLGYLLFTMVFMFLFLKFYAHLAMRRSLAMTAGFTLFVWLAFSLFLKLDIFAGGKLF
ncbi:MAG: tripartite tricarboxylate transporter TctB family protein [Dehalococcoidia bacterium]|nr:tripartite tricarboxylate transporter TctB family protein [Dehalococcoidia bacterium]